MLTTVSLIKVEVEASTEIPKKSDDPKKACTIKPTKMKKTIQITEFIC